MGWEALPFWTKSAKEYWWLLSPLVGFWCFLVCSLSKNIYLSLFCLQLLLSLWNALQIAHLPFHYLNRSNGEEEMTFCPTCWRMTAASAEDFNCFLEIIPLFLYFVFVEICCMVLFVLICVILTHWLCETFITKLWNGIKEDKGGNEDHHR